MKCLSNLRGLCVIRGFRPKTKFQLTETDIYDYVQFLREAAELVVPDTSLVAPIRDAADVVVVRTGIARQRSRSSADRQGTARAPKQCRGQRNRGSVLDA